MFMWYGLKKYIILRTLYKCPVDLRLTILKENGHGAFVAATRNTDK